VIAIRLEKRRTSFRTDHQPRLRPHMCSSSYEINCTVERLQKRFVCLREVGLAAECCTLPCSTHELVRKATL
jgi:hypothetical protein